MIFPLKALPKVSWHKNPKGTHFGANRDKRYAGAHPACDLIAAPGTEVLAVADGEVIRVPDITFAEYTDDDPPCHSITFALEVKHEKAGFIARYGEIAHALPKGVA